MKAIFLDIDGVLNYEGSISHCGIYLGIDNRRVKRLARIVKATGAKIILSSDWKDKYIHGLSACEQPDRSAKYLMRKLHKQGLKIYDTIDKRYEWHERADAILDYINKHNITDYVILDDRMFMGMHEKPLSDHFIKTMANSWESTSGLSEKLADIAIDILNGDKVGTFIDPDEAAYWHKPNPIDEDTKFFFKRW